MLKIYLGDLFHTWTKGGIYTVPLNIGYIATYTKKFLKQNGIDSEFRLFKDADKLIDAIKNDKPDVVGLGFFVWNDRLNYRVFEFVKENYPEILTIGGGPRFTNINANLEGAIEFFKEQKNCDAFVVNQGEKGFAKIIKSFSESNTEINEFKKNKIPGSIINDLDENEKIQIENCAEKIHVGENIGTIDDLNEIPSPYLEGILDEFFEDRYMPIIETNRSCPYRCTFCAWGIGTQKLMRFDEERINQEIEYIAKRCKNAVTLFIADANFGILERDASIAAKIYDGHIKHGFPKNVAVQWNKTRPDRIFNVAKEFKSIAPVGASMQTLDDNVLTAIKRKNLTFEQILKLQKDLDKIGIKEKSFTELIIGLPNETKKGHLEANRKLIDFGFEIWNYNLHLLPGTEMAEKEYRKKYFKKTGYRLFDNSYGLYEGKKIFEAQETVLETNTLKVEDFRFFRFYHFLQQMMWSKKWYYDFLRYLKDHGVHPVDFIERTIEKIKISNSNINQVYKEFMHDYDEAESFETYEELCKFWSIEKNFNRLKNGDYGKLNMLYTYKIMLEHRDDFDNFLIEVADEIIKNKKEINIGNCLDTLKDILKFEKLKFIQIDKDLNLKNNIKGSFNYNIIDWKNGKLKDLKRYKIKKDYNFYLAADHKKSLEVQLKKNKSKNINSIMRDMTVYSDTNQFFYNVKNCK